MTPRVDEEVALIKTRFPDLIYDRHLGWVLIPDYGAFEGWQPCPLAVVFQINPSHPGAKPYGFYTPTTTRFKGSVPQKFTAQPKTRAPFDGDWGFFSWSPENWKPAAEIRAGSNLFNWALSFAHRFREGA